MNFEWAERRVSEFIELLERHRSAPIADGATRADLDRQINEGLTTTITIAERFNPGVIDGLRTLRGYPSWAHESQLRAAQILLGAVRDAEELEENLGESSPKLSAADMHPWIWDHAKALLADGHGRAAVQAAGTALFDSHVPAKLGVPRDGKGGFTLMGAFSINDPVPSLPRLRFPGYDREADEQSWKSAHEGAMHLGQGCALAIRNLSTHDLIEPEAQEALEMLAALSLVARLVQRAEVVVA